MENAGTIEVVNAKIVETPSSPAIAP